MSRYFNKYNLREAAPTSSPNIAHSGWMHARHTLKCDTYKFNNRLRNCCYRYTTFQWWCGFSISIGNSTGNATEPWILVKMHMANERYQQNSSKWQTWPPLTVGLPVTSERYWASFQVTRLLHKVTVSQCDHSFAATYVFVFETSPGWLQDCRFFLTSIWWGSSQLQCIYYLRHILISRPPRVFRRFKRRSCYDLPTHHYLFSVYLHFKYLCFCYIWTLSVQPFTMEVVLNFNFPWLHIIATSILHQITANSYAFIYYWFLIHCDVIGYRVLLFYEK